MDDLAPLRTASVYLLTFLVALVLQKAEVGQLWLEWLAKYCWTVSTAYTGGLGNDPFMSLSLIFLAFYKL